MSHLRLDSALGWLGFAFIAVLVAGLTSSWVLLPKETLDRFRMETGLRIGLPEKHLLPEAYQGWVIVRFGVQGRAPLETEDGKLVFRYPESGLLETSTSWNSGIKHREYFYEEEGGWTQIESSGTDALVWGEVTIAFRERIDQDVAERRDAFFIGSREEYREAGMVTTSRSYVNFELLSPSLDEAETNEEEPDLE